MAHTKTPLKQLRDAIRRKIRAVNATLSEKKIVKTETVPMHVSVKANMSNK